MTPDKSESATILIWLIIGVVVLILALLLALMLPGPGPERTGEVEIWMVLPPQAR